LDQLTPDGRVRSLVTPVGSYDLAAIAAKLPSEQKPHVVVCLVDASWRNLPSNLAAFSCPKVLLIADTHHLSSPLLGTMRYLASEPYDRCVLLYDRHHAAFFHATGFKNLFWLPGLTFPHGDAAVRTARVRGARAQRIAFVGQAGKYHPRRTRLLETLKAAALPVVAKGLSQAESLSFYGSSLLGFNASLNGDFNLRILEILSVGGALLTDRLAPESGFDRLFADKRECLLYGSPEELAERAAHALAHPSETRAIGAAGARWFDEHYNEARRRELFRAVAFDGVAAPEFDFSPAETTRVFFGGNTDRLLESLAVYEGVQEIHRNEETVQVQIAEGEPADLTEIFSTLPRTECVAAIDDGTADLAVFNRSRMAQGISFNAPMVWCWDAQPADFGLLARVLAPAGFALASDTVALLCQQNPPQKSSQPDAPAAVALCDASPSRMESEAPSRDALRAMLLDGSTPGFDEFNVRQFMADNHRFSHVIFDWLDEILHEARLGSISNKLLLEAKELVRLYPSQKPCAVPPSAAVAPVSKAEVFQASLEKTEALLRAGSIAEAVEELQRAKASAPNPACVAKAEEVLAMIASAQADLAQPATEQNVAPGENIFSREERENIIEIIAAYTLDQTNQELLAQLRSLQHGMAGFLGSAKPGQIQTLFRGDFGPIYQELVTLGLGDDPAAEKPPTLAAAIEAGFSGTDKNASFDPRALLIHLLFQSNVSRTQTSHVYQ